MRRNRVIRVPGFLIHSVLALALLVSKGSESASFREPVICAYNWRIRFIITLFILKDISAVARPASRQLYGVYLYLGIAGQLDLDCHNKKKCGATTCLQVWQRLGQRSSRKQNHMQISMALAKVRCHHAASWVLIIYAQDSVQLQLSLSERQIAALFQWRF